MIRYNLRYAQNYGLIALFLVITLSCYAKSGESGGPKRTFVTLRRTDNGIGVYVSAEFMKRSDNKYIVPIVVMPREPKGVYSTLAVTFQAINVARQMDSYRSVESFYILTLCIVVIFSFVAVISSQKSNRTLDGYFLVLSPCMAGVILVLFIFRPHVPQYIIIGSQYDPTEIMNFAMTEQIGYGYFNCNVTVARPDADDDTEDTILIRLCYNAIGKNVEDIKICTPKMQGEFQLVVEGSWKCRELEKYFDSNEWR
ncbi:MAG: hypothetical protein LBJ46_11800 [Planctomycetota bacterium]|jgi:hypothetical protein|nr:hypothetical protein [Planctomycetota bacterium]